MLKNRFPKFCKPLYILKPCSAVSLICQTLRFGSILREIIEIEFFQNIQISSFSTLRVIGRRFGPIIPVYTYSWRVLRTALNHVLLDDVLFCAGGSSRYRKLSGQLWNEIQQKCSNNIINSKYFTTNYEN